MTKAELDVYRNHLLALRSRVNGDVSHLTDEALRSSQQASGNLSSMPIHMADVGSENFEQEFTLSLLANEEQTLSEIGAALERIDDGGFGKCEVCNGAIAKPRLRELPYTRYCVSCARKIEKGE